MSTIVIKNLPDALHLKLKERSKRHHRSVTKEVIALIEKAVADTSLSTNDIGPLAAIFAAGDQMAAMAWSEFRCGPASPMLIAAWEAWIASRIVPIDQWLAKFGARLFNETGRRSRSLADCLVAASAIQMKAAMVTLNRADFDPMLPFGLRLVDIARH